MASVLSKLRADVTRDHVLRAIAEYDRLGPGAFFAAHGYGPSRSYELTWDGRAYPHKAILGTAYELATGQRLALSDFEGGRSGAPSWCFRSLLSPSSRRADPRPGRRT